MPAKTTKDQNLFRVLSLDGGGARGVYTASFLTTIEDLLRVRIADHFDLIVGTSSGAMIALALALGMPARRILDLYLMRGAEIFANPRRLGMLLRPKYDNTPLRQALQTTFGQRTLNDVLTPICVTSYELTSSYPRIWKDDHAPGILNGGDEPAWAIAMASSAAPVYLPGAQVIDDDSHVDGGLFANNPTLIGLTEAAHYFHQPLGRIRILSVGTGESAERIPYDKARDMGVWEWRTSLYEHMLIAQARIAHEIARRLLRPGQYHRINIPLEHRYAIDDFEASRTLVEPGARAARTRLQDLRRRFLYAPATIGRAQKAAARNGSARGSPPSARSA